MFSARTKRIFAWTSGVVAAMFMAGVLGLLGMFWWYGRGVAAHDEQALRNYQPPQVTRILSQDGTLIGEIYRQRRTVVDYEHIPSQVENAFLAAEDADFYSHEGMDYFGMLRALLANVQAGAIRQGASTITQQVVKIFMLSPERTLERKVQELLLARRLERALSKGEILELYLNEIYLGHGRYGVEEASRFYFGKGIDEVDLGQAALLAGLPKAPSRDSPLKNPERAKQRQTYVLRQMVRLGWATARDAQRHIDDPLELVDRDEVPQVVDGAAEFVDVARAELEQRYGEGRLERLGATVTTTVDLDLQAAARDGLRGGLVAVDHRQSYGHGNQPAKRANLERARKLGRGPLELGGTYPIVVGTRPDDAELPEEGFVGHIGDHDVFVSVPEGSRYDDPDKSYTQQFPEGSITMVQVATLEGGEVSGMTLPPDWLLAEIDSGPQGAVVVAEAESGRVLAMVGGYDYERGEFNRALQAKRQPGSAFKPFVYGAALQSREFTAATLVSDSPEIYEKWRPTNFEADVYRGNIRLREALTHSVNTVAIKLLDAIGFEAVHEFAKAAGIESELAANLSLALGTSEVTPYELLRGYLTLARGGSRIEPSFITRIEVPGKPPVTFEPTPEPALSEDVVFVLTSMMQSVVQEGTGRGAQALERPVAGKTGTSGDHRDAWFAGFTPHHVAVAWVGFDTPRRIGRGETGGRAALPIWLEAMQAAEHDQEQAAFVPPSSVLVRVIDAQSGLLAPPGQSSQVAADQAEGQEETPVALEEYFLEGTEPVEEAVPEAMPAGDVLLDLYGNGDAAGADPTAPSPVSPPADAPPSADDQGARAEALPSLDKGP